MRQDPEQLRLVRVAAAMGDIHDWLPDDVIGRPIGDRMDWYGNVRSERLGESEAFRLTRTR